MCVRCEIKKCKGKNWICDKCGGVACDVCSCTEEKDDKTNN